MSSKSIAKATILEDGKVVINNIDDGNRIYNKHCFGTPISGGGLEVNPLEGAYLLEKKRLSVSVNNKNIPFREYVKWLKQHSSLDFQSYIGYRDLKKRGFIVKFTFPFDFSLYPGGTNIRNKLSKMFVDIETERTTFVPGEIFQRVLKSRELRKDYYIQVIDEEGDLTYYRIRMFSPRGKVEPSRVDNPLEGAIFGHRIIVFNVVVPPEFLVREFYGQSQGTTHQFSFAEALYLMKKGAMKVKNVADEEGNEREGGRKDVEPESLMELAKKMDDCFDEKYAMYTDLKKRGMIVKTGFKYGAHFRAYVKDPQEVHADFLFHIISPDQRLSWSDISGRVRVAHGVRKKMVFGFFRDGVNGGKNGGIEIDRTRKINYMVVERVKPYSLNEKKLMKQKNKSLTNDENKHTLK